MLGPLEARRDGRAVAGGGRRAAAVLAVLAIDSGRTVLRDVLIEHVWGPEPPPTAAHALEVQISALRKALGPGAVLTRDGGYALEVDPAGIDARRFEQMLAEGREALRADRPRAAAETIAAALGLWRGSALEDFSYEPFAQQAIAELEELRLSALEDLMEAQLALGHHAAVVAELDALIAEHPLRERLRGQLMLALYRSGRQAEALERY